MSTKSENIVERPIPQIADAVAETCAKANAVLDALRTNGLTIKGSLLGLPIDLHLTVS